MFMRPNMPFYAMSLATVLGLHLLGCGNKSSSDDQPSPQAPPANTGEDVAHNAPRAPLPPVISDEKTSDEFSTLAAGVIIRVSKDQSSQEQPSTAAMRLLSTEMQSIDASAAEAAFQSGQVPSLAGENDLHSVNNGANNGANTPQLWHDFQSAKSFETYRPRVYQRGGGGAYWDYLPPLVITSARNVYYYYAQPYCVGFCRPTPPSQPSQSGQLPPSAYLPQAGDIGDDEANYPFPLPEYPGYPAGYPTSYPGTPAYPGAQAVDFQLQQLMAQAGVRAVADSEFLNGTRAQFELGQMLFFDNLLSGGGDTSCATCHMPERGTSNALSLGPTLKARQEKDRAKSSQDLLPRNSPALFNRGHKSYASLLWDSRITVDAKSPGGYKSPAGAQLPSNLLSPLAAQALFPLASRDEMLGCLGANSPDLGGASTGNHSVNYTAVWSKILSRILGVPQYRTMFEAAYPGVISSQLTIAHLANALAVFQSMAWKANNSPFDRYLRGDLQALSPEAKLGATYFYGKAKCASCHSGALQTDHKHHAIAMPQFGPGNGDGPDGLADWGWGKVTGRAEDRYKFRTPSLRNVTLSAPYGHNGAYRSLRSIVEHYRNPAKAANSWQRNQVMLPFQITADSLLFKAFDDQSLRAPVVAANELSGIPLDSQEVDMILAFLTSLTDPGSEDLGPMIPGRVPSGLTIPRVGGL